MWEMLTEIKKIRNLTILITTHYMDEADRLCDRIAIVDHGKLVALDTPKQLKANVPGENVIEVQFSSGDAWQQRLSQLNGVQAVQPEGANMFRVMTANGGKTTTEIVEAALQAKADIKSLTVQTTTLDDVFVHNTGRALRDSLQSAPAYMPALRP